MELKKGSGSGTGMEGVNSEFSKKKKETDVDWVSDWVSGLKMKTDPQQHH